MVVLIRPHAVWPHYSVLAMTPLLAISWAPLGTDPGLTLRPAICLPGPGLMAPSAVLAAALPWTCPEGRKALCQPRESS